MSTRILGMPADIFAGLLLASAAVLGIVFENIPGLSSIYDALLTTIGTVGVGEAEISKPLLLWINDGLMAIFFLFVAIEIKREAVYGSLSSWSRAALPVYGAIGGIVVPTLVFVGIVGLDAAEVRGWAIPAATDIAFALGVLSLFGKRVPAIMKTFLLTLAVVDDLAAIVIIALFYTSGLSVSSLIMAAICLAVLAIMNKLGVRRADFYVIVGLVLWVSVLKSGVHATLAGVALGFAIPLAADKNGRSLAMDFEHALHPWVNLMILPVFAFANSGVPLSGFTVSNLMHPLALGVAAGLFIGKQAGVFGVVFLSIKLGLATRPPELTWGRLYGLALLAGIGFTMSLFIGGLAFDDQVNQNLVRVGVIVGSLLSGLLGALVIWQSGKSATQQTDIAATKTIT